MMVEKKDCPICGASFSPLNNLHLYCSRECKKKADNSRDRRSYLKQYFKTYTRKTPVKKNHCNIYIKTCQETGNLFVAQRTYTKFSKEGLKIRAKRAYKHPEPVIYNRICAHCGNEFIFKCLSNPTRKGKYCSSKCRRKAIGRIHHRIAKLIRKGRISRTRVEPIRKRTVFEAYNWQCVLCGVHTPKHLIGTNDRNEPTVDHIIPLSKGGSHTYDNLQLLCRHCNTQVKNDKIIKGEGGFDLYRGPNSNRRVGSFFSRRIFKVEKTA